MTLCFSTSLLGKHALTSLAISFKVLKIHKFLLTPNSVLTAGDSHSCFGQLFPSGFPTVIKTKSGRKLSGGGSIGGERCGL